MGRGGRGGAADLELSGRPGAPREELRVVPPGEADAAVRLDRLGGDVEEGIAADGTRQRRLRVQPPRVAVGGPDRVIGG
jgi:hypothetical protein